MNNLRDGEPPAVPTAANAIRQARQGEPADEWSWKACTQDDVDQARELVDSGRVDWRQRLEAAVAETLRRREGRAALRRDLDASRQVGLERRQTRKLNVADEAAIDPDGDRCRYLVSEEPPQLCPNRRIPGAPLCRPHLTRAAEMARRLGLDTRPDGEQR